MGNHSCDGRTPGLTWWQCRIVWTRTHIEIVKDLLAGYDSGPRRCRVAFGQRNSIPVLNHSVHRCRRLVASPNSGQKAEKRDLEEMHDDYFHSYARPTPFASSCCNTAFFERLRAHAERQAKAMQSRDQRLLSPLAIRLT